jgi:hypothetical protein
MSDRPDWISIYLNQQVVAEIGDGFTIFGILTAIDKEHLEFSQCDLHSQHEANSSRDVYAMETSDLGIRTNREHLAIPRWRLIAICKLDDVIG